MVKSKGIELTNDVGIKWRLACAAKSALGEPLKNAEGYPSFHIVDPEVACMVLEINGSGAWLHRASVERAEALNELLLAVTPVPDCSFTLLPDAAIGPSTEGLRGGKGFSERKYPSGELETVAGALAYFRDYPNDTSAAMLLSAQIAEPAAKRRKDLDKDLELALSFELAAFDRMEVSWLSDVGKQGYCDRVQKLLSLSWTAEKRKALQRQRRFCQK